MNFLAHLYLSGDSTPILIGNFIADFVKGKKIYDYDEDIIRGIILHRKIDHFTDRHGIVKESKKKLTKKFRHYSGVLVDIFYDHFLAKNWQNYADNHLEQYAQDCYTLLLENKHKLPRKLVHMLPLIIQENWLVNYAKVEAIDQVCQRMAQRTTFLSKMETAAEDLIKHYDSFEEEFNAFFPEIIDFVKNRNKRLE